MSTRAAAWLAWTLWALTLALTGLSLVLLALNLSHPNTHVFDWWLGNTTVVIDVTVGAIVASRRPENPVGWLLCLFGVAVSTSSFASQYAIYALLARLAPGGRGAGLGRRLAAARHDRPSGILHAAFSYGTIAERALEMVGVADRGFCPGGSDPLRVFP